MSDNRRDQLIEFVEREFIGPDPIDWPGMTQSNGQEILASDPPRTRYIAGILYPAETTDDKADLKDDECELLDEADGTVAERRAEFPDILLIESPDSILACSAHHFQCRQLGFHKRHAILKALIGRKDRSE